MDTVAKTAEIVQPSNVVAMQRSWIDSLAQEEMTLTARAEGSLVERLQAMENGAVIFAKRAEMLDLCHTAAIRRTRPEDWVLFKDRQGTESAMLTASGADLIAELYGIVVQNIRPMNDRGEFAPEKVKREHADIYGYRAWFDAFSRFNGRSIQGQECTRWSDEDFTGRSVSAAGQLTMKPSEAIAALDSDLRASVQRLILTKAVRVLCGMTRVPIADLRAAWQSSDKSPDKCRKGSGYGSGSERAASALTSDEVKSLRENLRDDILRCCGGDAAEARKLLVEITKGKDFTGFDSVEKMTKDWQVENAVAKLKKHPKFAPQSDTNGGAA